VCESEYATDVMFGEGSPDQPKRWRAFQRGLAHLNRRAAVSTAVNQRYLLALASVDEHTPLAQRVTPLCRPCRRNGRISRSLALLRARGLFRKVPHSHRYHLTPRGRTVITALLTARQADTPKLTAMAA
jgi:hypothetical protein